MATEAKLNRVDREALERALVMACRESPEEAAHIEDLLASRGWQGAATSASYRQQCKNLHLKPWQAPPQDVHTDEIGRGYGRSASEVRLRRHMLRLGISIFEPDPRAAIEQAESARRNTRVVVAEKKTAHPVA
jgi:hypothetical protein